MDAIAKWDLDGIVLLQSMFYLVARGDISMSQDTQLRDPFSFSVVRRGPYAPFLLSWSGFIWKSQRSRLG